MGNKVIIFKLFRSLQLQFSGLTGINFRYSYSFVGLTGICLYSYSSAQLHIKTVFGIIFRKLQLQLHKEMVFELKCSAPTSQRFLRFAIAMPTADPRIAAISERRQSNAALRFKGAMESR